MRVKRLCRPLDWVIKFCNELFHRSIAHGSSPFPSQPWEQPGVLPVFDLQKALFPFRLQIPVQSPPLPASAQGASSGSAQTAGKRKLQPVDHAWQRAVKAPAPKSSEAKRQEAVQKVTALLADYKLFFDLAVLASHDKPGEISSVEAVLATEAPSTILKHVGPMPYAQFL